MSDPVISVDGTWQPVTLPVFVSPPPPTDAVVIDGLRSMLAQTQGEAETTRRQLEEVTLQRDALAARVTSANQGMVPESYLRATEDSLKRMADRVAELEASTQANADTVAKADYDTLQAQVSQLTTEGANLRSQLNEALSQASISQAVISQLRAERPKLQDENLGLRVDLEARDAKIVNLRRELTVANDDLATEQESHSETLADIKLVTNKIVTYEATIKALQEQLQAQQAIAQTNAAAASSAKAALENNADAAAVEDLRHMLETAHGQIEILRQTLVDVQKPTAEPTTVVQLIAPEVELVVLNGTIDVRLSADGGNTVYRVLHSPVVDGFHRAPAPMVAQVLHGQRPSDDAEPDKAVA